MVKKLLFINFLALLALPLALVAQVSITGRVTDATTGEVLPGANVLIEELSRGAATSIDGTYKIDGVPYGNYTIAVSYIGYKTKKEAITVGNSDLTLDIMVDPDFLGLDEVVVTGYAQRDKQAFTGKVTTLTTEKIDKVPVASVEAALQGNVPGLNVTGATGTPGAEQQIRIRGISSINAGADPLFVIDGVPVVNGNFSQSTATSSLGVMANINPADIESITILKDAVSTAPYGARGTNGVVVITTKQGKFGSTNYNVKYQTGFSNRAVDGPGALDLDGWADLYATAYNNRYNPATPFTGATLKDALGLDGSINTDWGDVVRVKDAAMTDFAISARGGNKETTFYISGNFFNQEGAQIGSGLNRYTGKIDVTHQLDTRLKVSNSISGSFVEQDGFLEGAGYFGSPMLAEYFLLPRWPAYDENGDPAMNAGLFNPVYIQNNDINRKRNARLLNNTKLDFNIMDRLNFSSRFAIDYIQTEEKYYRNPYYGDAVDESGSVDDYSNRNFNYVWQNQLSYFVTPNTDNTIGVSLVQEFQRNYFQTLEAYGEGMAAANLYNLATVANPIYVYSGTTDWATQAYMALANYSFKEKLFLDASFRAEGNSRFSDDNRWGNFWSVGLGYVLSKEDFMKNISMINNLKLRTSYGKTGNAAVGLNQYQATVGFNTYAGSATILTNQLGNQDLTWETANSFDVGIDFGFLDRISGSLTYFNKTTNDLLYNVPLSRTSGHTAQFQNIGSLVNSGIEFEFNLDVVRTKDINWTIGGNFATLHNEITELAKDGNGEDIEITSATRYLAVKGYMVNQWFMKEWAGVDPANGDPLWYKDIVDANGNVTGKETTNVYADATPYDQGAGALPTFTSGFTTRLDVYGFYVSAQLNYIAGYKVFDSWANYTLSDGRLINAYNNYASATDYWTPTNTGAPNPKPILGGNRNSYSASTRYLYDGDHLRLRNVNIGYNLPSSLVRKAGLRSATIFMVGQNLWTYAFDKNLKFDPEVDADGFFNLNAMPMKSFTFGININF